MTHRPFRGFRSRRPVPMLGVLVLALVGTALFLTRRSVAAPESVPAGVSCMDCHGDVKRVEGWVPWISPARYEAGVHAGLGCQDCHEPRDQRGFTVVPHRLATSGPRACVDCHEEFEAVQAAVSEDVHAQRLSRFTCVRCHDPHALPERGNGEDVAAANRSCVRCHREAVARVVGERGPKAPLAAHAWLPETKTHLGKNSCVTCHAMPGGKGHGIRASREATRGCAVCHVKAEVELNAGGADGEREFDPVVFTHERHYRFDGHNVACVLCHHQETGDETWNDKWPRYLACSECHDSPDEEEDRDSSGPALDEAQDAYRSILHQLCISCHESRAKDNAPRSCAACHKDPDEQGGVR